MDDVLFAFKSSEENINNNLKKYNVEEDFFYLYGDRLKIQNYKGYKRKEININPNSALFVGQTMNDKAINKNGRNLTILDFKDEINEISQKYEVIYYSRHPYAKGDDDVIAYINNNKNIQLCNISAYNLIASRKIKEVISISSSVAIEAKYFGIKSRILYKPIINITGKDKYYSIYQSFVSPKFWSDILKGTIAVEENVPEVYFLDKKDKLRDMLAFYWSYKEIDKLEGLRQEFITSNKARSEKKGKTTSPLDNHKDSGDSNNQVNIEHIVANCKKEILKKKIISFDIFDTLVDRPLIDPASLFELMQSRFQDIKSIEKFPEKRSQIRRHFENKNKEEVTIKERYHRLADLENNKNIKGFWEYETLLDVEICKAKTIGKILFEFARTNKKKIILISDIYYDLTTVKRILEKCGYPSDLNIYLSSEANKLKLTGDLFDYAIEKSNIDRKDVLHIGDNKNSDIKSARNKGLEAYYVASAWEIFRENSKIPEYVNIKNPLASSAYLGLCATKWNELYFNGKYDQKEITFSMGSPYYFGYSILGLMFYTFAQWILNKAKKDNVTRLYFLARDGGIVKECFDVINKQVNTDIESYYLLSSRRSFNIPSLKSSEDIERVLTVNFSTISLKDLFLNRLGVDLLDKDIVDSRFDSIDEMVTFTNDLDDILKLAKSMESKILINANEEREELIEYLEKQNIFKKGKIGVVDIGHQGSMQRSLRSLTGREDLKGYYFCTFDAITKYLSDEDYSAFYQDKITPKDKNNDYISHILMYETIFLNETTSFVRIKNGSPVFLKTNEKGRIEFIRKVHAGIIQFAKDYVNLLKNATLDIEVTSHESTKPYNGFLKSPTFIDAQIFSKVCFENKYSGRGVVSVLDPKSQIWSEGAKYNYQARGFIQNRIAQYIFKTASTKKAAKFIANPKQYLLDSKNPFVQIIGKVFY